MGLSPVEVSALIVRSLTSAISPRSSSTRPVAEGSATILKAGRGWGRAPGFYKSLETKNETGGKKNNNQNHKTKLRVGRSGQTCATADEAGADGETKPPRVVNV